MNKIILYSLSTCPWCRKAKKFFIERNVHFDFIDYDLADEKTQKFMNESMSIHKAQNFPFAMINGEAVAGYNPDHYAKLLGLSRKSA